MKSDEQQQQLVHLQADQRRQYKKMQEQIDQSKAN